MEDVEITATFRPAPGDWTTLSKPNRGTIEALYRHPLAHNLEWPDVVALFEKLGTVDQKSHNEVAFGLGGEHHRVRKPHRKDLTAAEVMAFRHMLSRAGWTPPRSGSQGSASKAGATAAEKPALGASDATDLLVVMDHHEARLYHLDVRSADLLDHVIRPHDLHHLSHEEHAREHDQRTPEDQAFFERIAQVGAPARAIVLIGHGKGHSNAAHQLVEYVRKHHPGTFQKIACEVVADLSSLTAPQLLDLGRRALTVQALPPPIERPTP